MKIEAFKVENWMDNYEGYAKYDLGETCVDSMTVKELFEICEKDPQEFLDELLALRLAYGHIWGSPALRQGIASLYEDVDPDKHIVVTHGGIGANYSAWMSLVEAGDNVVSVLPTYQQHYSIPAAIGAEVRIVWLKKENDFVLDMDELAAQVDENTKMISFCSPDNPTGATLNREQLEQIAEIAGKVGAYVLGDEVYRALDDDGNYMASIADVYEKGISVGSMSKTFGLAGVRLGWLVCHDEEAIKLFLNRRDYDTISVGAIDDMISSLALANKDKIYARNLEICKQGRAILDKWVNETEGFDYVKPVSGTTALVYYDADVDCFEFCKHLDIDNLVLTTPGSAFEMEKCFRIGYAFSPSVLETGLEIIAKTLQEYK